MEASTEYPRVIRGRVMRSGASMTSARVPACAKLRRGLDVTAFGVDAIVMPPGIESGFHAHDIQEELYFVHRGRSEIEFGDGSRARLEAGCLARVDAATMRRLRHVDEEDAVYLCVGGKDGYLGRDGRVPDEDPAARVRRSAQPGERP